MYIGIDIGGTKCAVLRGKGTDIQCKVRFETSDVDTTLDRIMQTVSEMGEADAIGVSCGGPLDERGGRILSPPNLPGWDDVPITQMLTRRFGISAYLCNDANACALAEWKYGAGEGVDNMAFLTFGTGLGAGLILDGKLYRGATGNAGEIGHVRLSARGPVGYGKIGSAEGFCSGGGIARLGRRLAEDALQKGHVLPYAKTKIDLSEINARMLAEYARQGEPIAARVYRIAGERLGQTLSILFDLLDLDRVVIGSVFARAHDLLRPPMERVLRREALATAYRHCTVVPAALGESIGDVAALTVAEGL